MEMFIHTLGNLNVPIMVVLLATCLLLLYIYGKQPYGLWKKLGVPGPRPTAFLGNISDLYGPDSSKAAYAKWQTQYGRMYGIYFFRKAAIVITEPELIKQVLVRDFHSYTARFSYDGDALMNRELDSAVFFAKGDAWKRIRGIMTPSFSIAKIKSMTGIVNNSARRLGQHVLQCAKKGVPLDAKLLYGAFALDVVTGTAFSIDVDSVSNLDEPFTRHGRSLFILKKYFKLTSLLVCSFPTIAYHILRNINYGFFKSEDMDFFNTNIRRMIEERLGEENKAKRVDFLQLLIDAMGEESGDDDTSRTLTKREIVAQAIILFIAGYETASSTLQFLSYELTKHPDVLDKIVTEIDKVIGGDEPTYELCQNLKYTEAAINETLRMYPPLSVLTRQSEKEVTLNGVTLPPSTGVIIPLYILGRDSEVWENPDNFNPDRFMETDGASSVDPFRFLPFGIGPRICVGMKLGMFEMKLALIQVLKRVVFTNASPKKLHINDFTAILQPSQPIMINVSPRANSQTSCE